MSKDHHNRLAEDTRAVKMSIDRLRLLFDCIPLEEEKYLGNAIGALTVLQDRLEKHVKGNP